MRIERLAEALADRKGAWGEGAVRLRRRPLPDHRVRRAAEAAPATAAADRRRWRWAEGAAPRRDARPTSSASTRSSAPVRSAPRRRATRSATRPGARSSGSAKGAGERFDDLELQIRYFVAAITDDAQALAEAMAPGVRRVDPSEALTSGGVLAGSVDEVCDTLVRRREEWGVSYVVFGDDTVRAVRPGRGPPRRHLSPTASALSSSPTRTWLSW